MGDLQNDDIDGSITAFNQLIGDKTTNKADIASHYPHSAERHRLFINGSRFNLLYDSSPKFIDNADDWTLSPDAGDTIEYYTAERFRYAVGYVIAVGQAFQTNQSLQEGDKVVVGYGDADLANDMTNAEGWFVEFTSNNPEGHAFMTTYRDGTEVDRRLIRFEQPITEWGRIQNELNWYNVGNRKVRETYTIEGRQLNPTQNKSSVDGGKGPISGNQRLVFGVQAGPNTDNLELLTGSSDCIIKGNARAIIRDKAGALTGQYDNLTQGNFEAIAALRVDPSKKNINIQMTSFNVVETGVATDVQLLAISAEPIRTDATGFDTPIEHSSNDSALQVTTNVNEFPDSSGVQTTDASTPGGYQLGYASQYASGQGSNERISETGRVRKRNIYNGDHVVVLAKAEDATDITFEYSTEQQW